MISMRAEAKATLLQALGIYWPRLSGVADTLPLPSAVTSPGDTCAPDMVMIVLPEFASHAGVDGGILTPRWCVLQGEGPQWSRTDWLSAGLWYLHGYAERAYERVRGPVHSYSFRLTGWDQRHWDRAWVNRIGMFLRAWAAHRMGVAEDALGPMPAPSVLLTHDVDYLQKSMAVRLKQGAFEVFKAARAAAKAKPARFLAQLERAARFALGRADYQRCLEVADMEEKRGLTGRFNFYGGPGGWHRQPGHMLLDPAYRVDDPGPKALVRELSRRGHGIGLHQSFSAWQHAESMREQKSRVERALGAAVFECRQHWLRFSWDKTWEAQARAGLSLDTTLGFNDRPGFRNGAALAFFPMDRTGTQELPISCLPMLFMDSHFYDYEDYQDEGLRRIAMDYWLDEVEAVGGTVSVLWHPYVLSADFARGALFEYLLDRLASWKSRQS